ncbi:MAG: hemolysin family protein [Chloroflexota bacterium]
MLGAISTEVLIIFVLMLANGFFSGSEIAVVSARKSRLQQQADAGSKGARQALDLSNSPDKFLATVQVGITLIGTFASAFGGASIGAALAIWLRTFPLLAPYADSLGLVIVVLFITYVSLVIGELVPKRWALQRAEKVAVVVAPIMNVLARLVSPVIAVLSGSVSLIMRLLGSREVSQSPVTEEDITYLIREGISVGVVEPSEASAIRRIFQFTDRPVKAVMTSRPELVAVDAQTSLQDVASVFVTSGHSRLPVYEGSISHIIGVLHSNDVLRVVMDEGTAASVDANVAALLKPPTFLFETQHLDHAMRIFQQQGSHLGIVIDEYGDVAGIVTLQDLLEELVGEMPEAGRSGEEPEERAFVRREDGSWLVDAMEPYDRVLEHVGMSPSPHLERTGYTTLAGMLMSGLGHIPSVGDTLEVDGYIFEVVDMDGQRVDRVLVREARGERET